MTDSAHTEGPEAPPSVVVSTDAGGDDTPVTASSPLDRGNARLVATIVANLLMSAVLIGGGVAVAKMFLSQAEDPARSEQDLVAELVEVETVHLGSHTASFDARGQVVPAREFVVIPEVAGTLDEVHPALVAGGRVRAGETLLRINRRTYRAVVASRRAELAQAEAARDVERGLGALAEEEWDAYAEAFAAGEPQALALREPQLAQADAAVEAASTRLDLAQLDLRRTSIEAPFDAYVRQEGVELGQYVAPGMQLASLVATDEAWIQVAVPMARLDEIAIPGVNADRGTTVIARAVGGLDQTWEGTVLRLMGDLDPAGRQAQVIVSVPHPWGQPDAPRDTLPLLVGSSLEVSFPAAEAIQGVRIPRAWLRDGDHVWVLEGGQLRIREVTIVARYPDAVVVSAGLSEGDQVVTSRIGLPIDGMYLRTEEAGHE